MSAKLGKQQNLLSYHIYINSKPKLFSGKKQHFLTSLAQKVSVVISGFLPTKKTFFDESKRILLTWTAFKHHQKQKPRGRKNGKRKTQLELLSSYFYFTNFSKPASKAIDFRDDMLTRHKSSWLPDFNLAPKMKQWNTLTAEEEEGSGKNTNAKILQNLSATFLQFSYFTTITFFEDNIIIRIGEFARASTITFYIWKKKS